MGHEDYHTPLASEEKRVTCSVSPKAVSVTTMLAAQVS